MKTLFTIYILFVGLFLQSQTIDNDKAHRRYWYYRARMINDFMKIGKNQGDGLVFAERNIGEDNTSYVDVTPEFEINLSGYSKAIYMAQLISTTGKVSSKRVDIIQ